MPELPEHGLTKDGIRAELQLACAIVFNVGSGKSLLELCVLILEEGLPSRAERERIRDELASDEGTTPPLSPPPS